MTVSSEVFRNNYLEKDSLTMTEVLDDKDIKRIEKAFISEKSQRIVFVDGVLVRLLSAFDQRYSQDGVHICIPKNTVVKEPIEVLYYARTQSIVTNPKLHVVCDENSQLVLIEHYLGSSEVYQNESEISFAVKSNANCMHYRIQEEGINAIHKSKISGLAANGSVFKTYTFSFGSNLSNNDVQIDMKGTGVDAGMFGLSVLSGDQQVHNNTVLNHDAPRCESRELYKGIYDDKSSGTFIGTIIVEPGAQKTNAIQSNRALLLTTEASIYAQPQLKIWADDVKCTHGATVGQLDNNALFYIRSRGVDEASARGMLIHAFASEVISEVSFEPLRVRLEEKLIMKLGM